jgi:SAM-dependent methyltransferase
MMQPFDAAAASYDTTFTDTRLGRWLRAGVWRQLAALFAPGERVLELGCGTGEDAVWLARRGVRVTATDISTGMLAAARAKAHAAGLAGMVDFAVLDIGAPGLEAGRGAFDGAFSDFGALNCVPDRRPLAGMLAGLVRPGGRVALVVMGPLCPWEFGYNLARGRRARAMRRLRAGQAGRVAEGVTIGVWYPSPRRLRAELASDFRHVRTVGIGALLPPSGFDRAVERMPGLFGTLALLEERVRGNFPWSWLNDHYMAIFERR